MKRCDEDRTCWSWLDTTTLCTLVARLVSVIEIGTTEVVAWQGNDGNTQKSEGRQTPILPRRAENSLLLAHLISASEAYRQR